MPTKQEVGRRVRLARFRRDMTLKEVAARSGMSATHISEIERGKTSPTIGALQRIAAALEERTAHFVEEHDSPTVVVTRKSERAVEFVCDANSEIQNFERLNGESPWATLTVARKVTRPGESMDRPPALGEFVAYCASGMFRYTISGDDYVVREGDTIQFHLDEGYRVENIGEDKGEIFGFVACPGRRGW